MAVRLRSYRTKERAEVYAKTLRRKFPRAEFEVVISPFAAYAFRWLILCTRGRDGAVGGSWVSK